MVKKYTGGITVAILGLALFCCCTQSTVQSKVDKTLTEKTESATKDSGKYEAFELSYSYAGLGSGMGSMEPTFRVTGKNYLYTLQQNSYIGKPNKKTEQVSKGILRTSSIDSILNLVKEIKDTLVYRTDIGIMSGCIRYISVKFEKINVNFKLHNATDSTAEKIIAILNSNIPADKRKL